MSMSDESAWRDSIPGGWDERSYTAAEQGLLLPSCMSFGPGESGSWLLYLFISWIAFPLTAMLLMLGGKNPLTLIIGTIMLIAWLCFAWNRTSELFCLFGIIPAGILAGMLRNIKRTCWS
jgi:hypothetical protein